MYDIPFNKPTTTGLESKNVEAALRSGKLSGDGPYSKRCQSMLESRFGFGKSLLTTSCTDALEMAALLLQIAPGDEVIMPSYTFVSTANAFALRGASIVFADSEADNPNISAEQIEALITDRTRAIVVVHYAGVACDMDRILALAAGRDIVVVEDAAQGIDSYYKGRPLGGIGALGTFSFHETKNISCGEGGLLAINDLGYTNRAEIIREKGTNRTAFFRGEADKYGWVDLGSSFLPSEMNAAYLEAQLIRLDEIQGRRKAIWLRYEQNLSSEVAQYGLSMPVIPNWATNNAHMFYMVSQDVVQRSRILEALRNSRILATFHYQALHSSSYFADRHDGRALPNCDRFTNCLLRLPLYFDLTDEEVDRVSTAVIAALSA